MGAVLTFDRFNISCPQAQFGSLLSDFGRSVVRHRGVRGLAVGRRARQCRICRMADKPDPDGFSRMAQAMGIRTRPHASDYAHHRFEFAFVVNNYRNTQNID